MSNGIAILALAQAMKNKGGGGGTSDYTALSNKPKINNVELSGNKTAANLGLVEEVDGKGLSTNDYSTEEKNKLAGIAPGANNYVLPSDVVQDSEYSEIKTKVENTPLFVLLTQEEYDALPTKDPNTLYMIKEV